MKHRRKLATRGRARLDFGLSEAWKELRRQWPKYKAPDGVAVDEVRDRPKYFAHRPFPKQQQFLDLTCEEALFGGAAGGGKSDAILMAALQNVDVPGYSAIILRKDLARLDLAGAIMDRAKAWLAGTSAKWNQAKCLFTFPSGAKLQFGFINNVNDRFRYGSSEYHFIGWDELTEIDLRSEEDETNPYLFMFSRLRRTKDIPVRPIVRAATNPGQVGHAFVKQYFLRDAQRDEKGIYWKTAEIDIAGRKETTTRAFVPSLIKDNYAMDEWEYSRKLARLPKVTRERLLAGNWDIQEGTLIDTSLFGRYETEQSGDTELLYPLEAGKRTGHIDGRLTYRFATVDTAGSSRQREAESRGKAASYSVIAIWDAYEDRLFLREIVRGRFEWMELKQRTIDVLRRWGVPRTYIENETVGPVLAIELGDVGITCDTLNCVLPGMTTGLNAKYERAVAAGLFQIIEDGSFYVPAVRSKWLDDFESEMGSWTGRLNETADQIDTSSYGAYQARMGQMVSGGIVS